MKRRERLDEWPAVSVDDFKNLLYGIIACVLFGVVLVGMTAR